MTKIDFSDLPGLRNTYTIFTKKMNAHGYLYSLLELFVGDCPTGCVRKSVGAEGDARLFVDVVVVVAAGVTRAVIVVVVQLLSTGANSTLVGNVGRMFDPLSTSSTT